jgi:hypothetical protein
MAEDAGGKTEIGRMPSPDYGGDAKSIDSDAMKLAGLEIMVSDQSSTCLPKS